MAIHKGAIHAATTRRWRENAWDIRPSFPARVADARTPALARSPPPSYIRAVEDWDIVVAGAGFGGALVAAIAARTGRRVLLLEKGRHPRFAIGESSTPLSNLILERLATTHRLDSLAPIAKWGAWRRNFPSISGGLKRGFTFFHHEPPRDHPARRESPDLMVAASPNDEIGDTHWFRADVDQHFVRAAVEAGVTYLDAATITEATTAGPGVELSFERPDGRRKVRAKLLIDATGPAGLLHRLFGLSNAGVPGMPDTCTLYSHFTGVDRDDATIASGRLPFPPDDAAVHHLFDGGWIWVLRFNNGVTSAGVSMRCDLAEKLALREGPAGWLRLLGRLPDVARRFKNARPVREFTWQEPLPYRASQSSGQGWLMLPSAAGFVDPLMSTGFALTLLGVERLAAWLAQNPGVPDVATLAEFAAETEADLLAAARLISALYARLADPAGFRAIALIYFVAVSYAETARRLGRADLAPGFLMRGRPDFWLPASKVLDLGAAAPVPASELLEEGRRACDAFDIGDWFARSGETLRAVEFEPLFRNCGKLGASPDEIREMLRRAGIVSDS
jgi:tetracycline 7-halogenase / FADH2 O2-dependent halogenase